MEWNFKYESEYYEGLVLLCIVIFALNPDLTSFPRGKWAVILWYVCFIACFVLCFASGRLSVRCLADDEKITFWLFGGRKEIFYYQDIVSVEHTYQYFSGRNYSGYKIDLTIRAKEDVFFLRQIMPYEREFKTNPDYFTEKLESTDLLQIEKFLNFKIQAPVLN